MYINFNIFSSTVPVTVNKYNDTGILACYLVYQTNSDFTLKEDRRCGRRLVCDGNLKLR